MRDEIAVFVIPVTLVTSAYLLSMAEKRVLNAQTDAENNQEIAIENDAQSIAKQLQKLMLQIKGQFMCDEGKTVDYSRIKTSGLFLQHVEECKKLVNVDLKSLADHGKMAFFISIFCN